MKKLTYQLIYLLDFIKLFLEGNLKQTPRTIPTFSCTFLRQAFSEPTTTSSMTKWWLASTPQPPNWPSLWTLGKSLVIQNAKSLYLRTRNPSARRVPTSSAAEHCSKTRSLHSVSFLQSLTPSPSSRPVSLTTRNATPARPRTWSIVTQLLLTSSSLDCEEYGPSICLSVVSVNDFNLNY